MKPNQKAAVVAILLAGVFFLVSARMFKTKSSGVARGHAESSTLLLWQGIQMLREYSLTHNMMFPTNEHSAVEVLKALGLPEAELHRLDYVNMSLDWENDKNVIILTCQGRENLGETELYFALLSGAIGKSKHALKVGEKVDLNQVIIIDGPRPWKGANRSDR